MADRTPPSSDSSPSKEKPGHDLDKPEMVSIEDTRRQRQHQEELGLDVESESDSIDAKKVMRKIDWRLLPLLIGLYTLTFLDRVNIGNARLWHLERDLSMTGYDYNIAVLGKSTMLSLLLLSVADSVSSILHPIHVS